MRERDVRTGDATTTYRLAVVSDRVEQVTGLDHAFAVFVVPFVGAEQRIVRQGCDVILVDAIAAHRFAAVASIAAANSQSVVVRGPLGASEEAMRYLDVGAADYVSERASAQELIARLEAAARRPSGHADEVTVAPGLTISRSRRIVRRDGERAQLSPHEYSLLEAMTRDPGRTFSQRELVLSVWGSDSAVTRARLRLYVKRLREKVEDDAAAPSFIVTVRGVGYRTASEVSGGPPATVVGMSA